MFYVGDTVSFDDGDRRASVAIVRVIIASGKEQHYGCEVIEPAIYRGHSLNDYLPKRSLNGWFCRAAEMKLISAAPIDTSDSAAYYHALVAMQKTQP